VAPQSPAGVILGLLSKSNPVFQCAKTPYASAYHSTRATLAGFDDLLLPSAKSNSRAKSGFALLLIGNPAIQQHSRMNYASGTLMLRSFMSRQCLHPSNVHGARLASKEVVRLEEGVRKRSQPTPYQ